MNEELRLWMVGEAGEVEPLSPVSEMPSELALEDLLVRNPEMLETGLKLVGRQTPTESGWLDLLAVDRDGRLVVYELKRGTLARDAVTQVLDYASDLNGMDVADLSKHIAERSGKPGIDGIEDFEQWYLDNFGGDDLSRLLPPRMVLMGLGVDPVVERMARFISGGPVDVSVVTFQGFLRGEDRLLARQMEVPPPPKRPGYANIAERRRALREYLARNDYAGVFDPVHDDLRSSLPKGGVWEEPRATGISFLLTKPDDPSQSRTYIGVYAGHDGAGVYSVSILPEAIRWGAEALEALKESINPIKLSKWTYGGLCFFFKTKEEWAKLQPAMHEFLKAAMANRAAAGAKPPST